MEIMLINTMIKAVKTTEECHRSSQNKGIVYMLFILTISPLSSKASALYAEVPAALVQSSEMKYSLYFLHLYRLLASSYDDKCWLCLWKWYGTKFDSVSAGWLIYCLCFIAIHNLFINI